LNLGRRWRSWQTSDKVHLSAGVSGNVDHITPYLPGPAIYHAAHYCLGKIPPRAAAGAYAYTAIVYESGILFIIRGIRSLGLLFPVL